MSKFSSILSRIVSARNLRVAIENEQRSSKGTVDLSTLLIQVNKRGEEFEACVFAHCTNEYRTGIGTSQVVIFKHSGFQTLEGGVGFITEQVSDAASKFPDTDFLTSDTPPFTLSRFDSIRNTWLEVPPRIYSCGCGHIHKIEGKWLMGWGDALPICKKCNSPMREAIT